MTFQEWLETGIAQGWVTDQFCLTHDTGLTDDELDSDACVPGLRVLDRGLPLRVVLDSEES